MGKGSRRRPRAGEQIESMARAGLTSGLPGTYPKSIQEAINRGETMHEALRIRNARQKSLLDKASRLMKRAVDECNCGGVARAIELEGYSQPAKGGGDGEAGAPDAEGD